mgnify:CR=1 FL=1
MRLFLSSTGTLSLDFNTFVAWSQQLVRDGLGNFYNGWSDYLPGYLYVLWLLGQVNTILPALPDTLLYKLPAILADVATGALIFFAVSRFNKKLALPAAALYLFNPAVFANSTLWGQIDGITVFLALSSIFFAKHLPLLSAAALGAGALVKPQAGFIAPIVAVLLWKTYGLKKTIGYAIFSLLIFLGGFVPFAHGVPFILRIGEFISFVVERLGATANQYPYSSINAFNFWALITGLWKPDGGGLQIGGIVVAVTVLSLLLRYWWVRQEKSKTTIWLVTALWFVVSFLFLTRMHERHLLPTFAPLAIAAAQFPLLWLPYAILSATYLANLRYSYVWITEGFRQIFSQGIIDVFVVINLIAAGLMVVVFLRPKNFQFSILNFHSIFNYLKRKLLATDNRNLIPGTRKLIPDKLIRPLLAGVLGFALLSRLAGLWFPPTFYFDEVYHAFTAKEMLQGNNAAWEWWNTPPKGFAYEWTHPPLAKLGMVAGMVILGERPLGWRLPGALLGVGVIFLVYLLGVQLFRNKTVGLLAAAVFALDGLPLVMSRVGMNDTYFLFFALLSVLFFLKERYFFSSVFLGLAAASKWTTVWVVPLLFVLMLLFKQKPRWRIVWFAVIPPALYLASYIPFFLGGHSVSQFIELQKQMWWYHTNLQASHAYQSSWWTWPLSLRPVWFFAEGKDGFVSNIFAVGNPFVFWGGIVTMAIAAVAGIRARIYPLLAVVAAWGLLFLPWALSPRVMFLYHYLPAVPFLSLAIGWYLSTQKKDFILITFSLLLIIYIFFFPHWTGVFVPRWLDNFYYWLPTWR